MYYNEGVFLSVEKWKMTRSVSSNSGDSGKGSAEAGNREEHPMFTTHSIHSISTEFSEYNLQELHERHQYLVSSKGGLH